MIWATLVQVMACRLVGAKLLHEPMATGCQSYLSNTFEGVVVVLFNQHLIQNGLRDILQSAYKQNHST